MLKLASLLTLGAFASAIAPAQAPPPRTFEVASVKPAAPCCSPGQWRESKAFEDRIDFPFATLRSCIAFAYRLKEYQVSGPAWINDTRYEILAKGPEGARRDELPEMLQALLAERFKLAAHIEKKDYNVYALVVGKNGPKLETAKSGPGTPDGAAFGMSMGANGIGKIEARHADMASLGNTLLRLVGRPVVDLTGLTGRYDFDLEFSREDGNGIMMPPPAGAASPAPEFAASVFTSIQRLGLRLDSRKYPLDTVVVDRAEKTATEN